MTNSNGRGGRRVFAALAAVVGALLLIGAGCSSGDGDQARVSAGTGGSPGDKAAPEPTTASTTAGQASTGPGTIVNGASPSPSEAPTRAPAPSTPPGESGVTGIVEHNPCPASDTTGCDARRDPLAATVVVVNAGTNAEVTRTTSPADGRYAARVPPGRYRLTAQPAAPGLSCTPVEVTVPSGSYAEIDIECR